MYVMASEAAASPAHSGKQERKCKVRSGEGKRRIMMRAQDQILRNIEWNLVAKYDRREQQEERCLPDLSRRARARKYSTSWLVAFKFHLKRHYVMNREKEEQEEWRKNKNEEIG
jgi:hypothetical protein